jgi:hypothetical protein
MLRIGFLVSLPSVGALADATSLRVALLTVVLAGVGALVLGRALPGRTGWAAGRLSGEDAGTAAAMALRNAAVAAAGQWVDPDDGIRYPAGEVHGWERGRNETVCGLSLSRSRLARFPHVSWADVQPESGRHAEEVQDVCRRCRAALGGRRDDRGWTRTNPRP